MTGDPLAWAVAAAAVVVVVGTVAAPGTVATARESLRLAQGAAATLRDPGRDDVSKERAARKLSLTLFGVAGRLILRLGLAVAAAAVLVLAAGALDVAAVPAVTGLVAGWPGITGAIVLALPLFARTLR